MDTEKQTTSRRTTRRRLIAAAALAAVALMAIILGVPRAGGADTPVLASYFYSTMSLTHLEVLARHGFNTALIKYSIDAWPPAELDDLAGKVERGRELGLRVMPVVNAHNPRILDESPAPHRCFRDRRGRTHDGVPCPADTNYWSAWWREMVLPAARIGSTIAVDLELYGAGDLHHWSPSPCTCLDCVLEYTGYTADNRDLAAEWLDRLGERDLEDLGAAERRLLTAFFTGALRGLAADSVRVAVLDLGRPGLVTRSLVLALERLSMPVVDFTELTYAEGARVPAAQITATYDGIDLAVRTVPGFWLLKWRPDELEREAVSLGARYDGYWIFTSYSLHVPPEELEGHYDLNGSQPAYWLALEETNLALRGPGD